MENQIENLKSDQKLIEEKIKNLYEYFLSNKDYSDLHIKTNTYPRLRCNADIKTLQDFDILDTKFMEYLVAKIFRDKFNETAEKEFKNFLNYGTEADFAIDLPNSDFRARLNIAKSMGEIKITYRKIPNDMPLLETLNIRSNHLEIIRKIMSLKEGLVLITGQTGSGKSTTLASIINEINQEKTKHIVTIEHPVEFRHKDVKSLITHREVGEKSDTKSFSDGLRAAVRQDPDIIMVGEMRDAETAIAALQAAQTGHLVFATLHTNSAPETVVRILDLFPPEKADSIRVSLAESLKLIISQKLVPTVDNKRVLSYECLFINNNIKNAISSDKLNFVNTIKESMNTNYREGMLTMNRSLKLLLDEGKITKEMAFEYSNDSKELDGLLED